MITGEMLLWTVIITQCFALAYTTWDKWWGKYWRWGTYFLWVALLWSAGWLFVGVKMYIA